MSHTLSIKRDGIYAKEWVYDKKKKEGDYVCTPVNPDYILSELHNGVEEIEEGYTLRDYFETVLQYKNLILLDAFFPSFLKEAAKCPKRGCSKDDMPTLFLKRSVCVEIKGGKVDNIENFVGFSGSRLDPEDASWAVEFTPLSEMLDTPLTIEKTSIYITRFKGYKHISTLTYTNPDIEFMSLFDFITEPIWELSFCGTPVSRDKKKKDLDKSVKSIDNGTAKLIPWKEIEERLKNTTKKGEKVIKSKKLVKKEEVKETVKTTPVKKTTKKK